MHVPSTMYMVWPKHKKYNINAAGERETHITSRRARLTHTLQLMNISEQMMSELLKGSFFF